MTKISGITQHASYISAPSGGCVEDRTLLDVLDERARQYGKWGGGGQEDCAEHDDTHSRGDWLRFVQKQVGLAFVHIDGVDDTDAEHGPRYRARLVKIAALALAAIESFDRRAAGGVT